MPIERRMKPQPTVVKVLSHPMDAIRTLRVPRDLDDQRRYIRCDVQCPDARAEKETAPPATSILVVGNNGGPGKEHKRVKFVRYTEAATPPVSQHPQRQYQLEFETPKQSGGLGCGDTSG